MVVFTKKAVDIFSPVDAGGAPRGVVNSEAQVWGAEAEAAIQVTEESVADLSSRIDDLSVSGDVIAVKTWAELSAIIGSRANQRATVESDPTSHTDPVTGANVPESTGVYGWSASPAGWRFLGKLFVEDALSVNAGKAYPLKSVPRNGVTSSAHYRPVNGLLDIKVFGARTGKFYRLEYYGNGNSTYGYQIAISEYDAATYYAGNPTATVIIALGDFPRPSIETGPIVTHTVYSSRVPGVGIQFTIDRSKSDEANPWAMNQSGNPGVSGYSWIIDPSCYEPANTGLDSRTINSGKAYPLKSANRGGIVSKANVDLNNLILDAVVHGAEPGKLYQFAYYQNGAAIGGVPGYGMIIKEFDAATFESAGTETIILGRTSPAPAITRNTGVQVVSIYPILRPNIRIDLTVNTDVLLPDGTIYNANDLNTRDGWSWIIDPVTYRNSDAVVSGGYGSMMVTAERTTKKVAGIWSHGIDKMMRLTLRPNGKNSLFNVASVEISDASDLDTAVWNLVNGSTTDWFPPLIVQSMGSPVDGGEQIYTGGNHGSDGSAGGVNTAEMIDWSCEVDGRVLTGNFTGAADRVVVRWTNRLMAYNTITYPRYVLRQYFTAVMTPGSIELWCEIEALESIRIQTDNGPQMIVDGYDDYLYYGGALTARNPISTNGNSGPKSSHPDAYATVLKSAGNGIQVSWMDRSYEAGTGSYVASSQAFMRKGTTGNDKQYHAIVAGVNADLATGQGYKWHGGYAWAPASLFDGGIDSAFTFRMKNAPFVAYAFLVSGNGFLNLPPEYSGKSVGSEVVSPRNRVAVNASGISYQLKAIA